MLDDDIYRKYIQLKKNVRLQQNQKLKLVTKQEIHHYDKVIREFYKSFASNFDFAESDEDENSLTIEKLLDVDNSNYTSRFVEEIKEKMPEYGMLSKDLDQVFQLFVMGPGNHGKSTLINSLIGTQEKYAAENIQPKTWKIDRFEKSSQFDQAEIIYKNGTSKTVSRRKAQEIIDEEERKKDTSGKKIKENKARIVREKKLKSNEIKELEIKLQREFAYSSSVAEVRWGIKDSQILDKFSIVDTPGLDQSNSFGEVTNNVQEYYHKADGVIWLLDATAISAKNSSKLLEKLNESLENMGGKRATDSMIAVLNRIDLVDTKPGEREKVLEEAERIFRGKFKKIIPYSASLAYEAAIAKDNIQEQYSGRIALLSEINETFFYKAVSIQAQKKKENCQLLNQQIIKSLDVYQNQLEKDSTQLARLHTKIPEEVERKFLYAYRQLEKSLKEHSDKVSRNLIQKIEQASEFEDSKEKEKYIKKTIYQIDLLESMLSTFSMNLQKTNEELRIIAKKEYHFSQYESLNKYRNSNIVNEKIKVLDFDASLETWMPSIGKSTIFTALGAGMVFGPLGALVGAGIGAYFSNKTRESTINTFIKQLDEIHSSCLYQANELSMEVMKTLGADLVMGTYKSFNSLYDFDADSIDDIWFRLENVNDSIKKSKSLLNDDTVRFMPSVSQLIFSDKG